MKVRFVNVEGRDFFAPYPGGRMTGLLKAFAVKLVKGHWGRIIPAIFKAAGEGDFGPQIKAVYWFGEKYATVTGAILWGVGAAMETVCSGYPVEYAWSCDASRWIVTVGTVLASVGLLRGATNSPWPEGAQANHPKKENQ